MDKFIVFNDGVFNTRHIIAMCKTERTTYPTYGIELHQTNNVIRQWFNEEYNRDYVFNRISEELLNE